jgi:SAM-dependent methyltransferase
MTLRSATVWRAKLLAKLTLSHVPVPRSTWRKIGLFKLGLMTAPSYALATFEKNVGRRWVSPPSRGDDRRPVFEPVLDDRASPLDLSGLRLLELGPGELLSSAVIAHAGGAESMTLVDAGPYALPGLDRYRELAALLSRRWGCEVDAGDAGTLHEILTRCRARYLTDGLESLRRLPAASVDVAWSHAMLEHVREPELLPLLRELRRVLAPDGITSHQVDLQDHLDYALNNLRFSRRVWESGPIARSGCYTNRVGFSRMLELFSQAGFETELVRVDRWDSLPTPRSRLAPEFRSLPDDDLLVRVFDVLLRPTGSR